MTPTDLYNLFRSDVTDDVAPYLWTDTEVWDYMDDAYSMFVRLRGGIPDATSAVTQIPVVANAAFANIDPRIMKIRRAVLASTNMVVDIKNVQDTPLDKTNDYGTPSGVGLDYRVGPVYAMVIGEEEGLVRWVNVPAVNDTVNMVVWRLPLNTIDQWAGDDYLNEIQPPHHRHLLMWMKHRAYSKQDTETLNKGKAAEFKADFEAYCAQCKAELDRQRSKNRSVVYGGL